MVPLVSRLISPFARGGSCRGKPGYPHDTRIAAVFIGGADQGCARSTRLATMSFLAGPHRPVTGRAARALNAPEPGDLEARASLALKFLAGINVFGIIFASFPGLTPMSLFEVVAYNAGAGALAVVYIVVARALDQGEPWSIWAIRPLLLLLLTWGTYTFLAAVAGGALRIPMTGLVAGLALFLPAERRPFTRLGGRVGAVLAVTAALIVFELVTRPLFGWGGLFDVHERDLRASLTVDCGGPTTGLPERLTIAYDWSWSADTLLPNEEDQILIGWNGDDAAGHPLYLLGHVPDPEPGFRIGLSTGVSNAMALETAEPWRGVFMWRIDMHIVGIRPGRIEFQLRRAPGQASATDSLTIGASYIHVGTWRQDAAAVTCSW